LIELLNDYYIDVDEYNYTLKKDTGRDDKDGNRTYNAIGYYPSLKHSIKACLAQLRIDNLKGKDMPLKMAIIEIEKSTKMLNDKLNEVLPNIKITEAK